MIIFNLSNIAMLYIGTPYVYGGNTVEQGFDCSGLVCECLRGIGELGKEDLTAQGIFNKYANTFEKSKQLVIKENTILFFGKDYTSISHVGIAINSEQMIEAGGEGAKSTDQGSVRIRPISWRSDFLTGINL